MQLLTCVLSTVLIALTLAQVPSDCDLTPITFGCPSVLDAVPINGNVSAIINVGVAKTAPLTIPLRVLSIGTETAVHVQSVNATGVAVAMQADVHMATLTLDANNGRLRMSALDLEWIIGSTRVTIDVSTGCLLINGTFPLRSPCAQPMIDSTPPATAPIVPSDSNHTESPRPTLSAWDATISAILIPVVVGVVCLLIGVAIACPIGMCIQRRRMKRGSYINVSPAASFRDEPQQQQQQQQMNSSNTRASPTPNISRGQSRLSSSVQLGAYSSHGVDSDGNPF